jgi:hypothetical protein
VGKTKIITCPKKIKLFNVPFVNRNEGKSKPRYGFQQSKTKRPPRRYYINDNQTQLLIIQGDITRTKVDAIVNGLFETLKKTF